MASEAAIRQLLERLECRGLGGTPRALTHGSPAERQRVRVSLVADWGMDLADVTDEDLWTMYRLWSRDPQACRFWPQGAALLAFHPSRTDKSRVEMAAAAAWQEIWAGVARWTVGPGQPRSPALVESYRTARDHYAETDRPALAEVADRAMLAEAQPVWVLRCGGSERFVEAALYALRAAGGVSSLMAERSRGRDSAEVETSQRIAFRASFVAHIRDAQEAHDAQVVHTITDRTRQAMAGGSTGRPPGRHPAAMPSPRGPRQLTQDLDPYEISPNRANDVLDAVAANLTAQEPTRSASGAGRRGRRLPGG